MPGPTSSPLQPSPLRSSPLRAALAATAGTAVEYYDFVIFGTAAALAFGHEFFPTRDPASGTLAALASYAVAFLARPLGGLLFGPFGDRFGRRSSLVATVTVMGTATFLIGLLPTYATIGVAAPVLLVLLRFLQGLALGGEWGGATLMAVEHAPAGRRGFYGTFVQLGSAIGPLLASGAFLSVKALGGDPAHSAAWRIPFLLSAVLTAVGLYLRLSVTESPEFTAAARTGTPTTRPVREVFARYRGTLALAAGAMVLGTGGYQLVAVFLVLVYMPSVGVSVTVVLLAGVVLSAATAATLGLYGRLGDRIGLERASMIGCVYSAVAAFPMFMMADTGNTALVLLAVPVCFAGANLTFGLNSALLASHFDAGLRNTAVSLASAGAALFGGALVPLLSTWLRTLAHGAYWPAALLLVAQALVSLAAVIALRRPPPPSPSPSPGSGTQGLSGETPATK
ncbi:MFS transporter [Kitasatospora phosalacinea]|uniref:MFS transporter n=1 Tax=Kitasatospora phosalacinea TaxID=2065 RepID=UPI0036539D53